jgi:TRAP transporter TAXI family solute receptor
MKGFFLPLYKRHAKKVIMITSLLVLLFTYMTYRSLDVYTKDLELKIKASALKGGEYGKFLLAFVNSVNQDSAKYKIKVEQIESPRASVSTLEQLDSGTADIGLAQSNVKLNSKNVASIAYVYVEPYLLVTNRRDINSISDIAKSNDSFKVARLEPGTQTSKDFRSLFDFYGIDTFELKPVNAVYDSAYIFLKEKRVDLGFFIVGLGNRAISLMMKDTSMHLVHFENLEAYLLRKHKLINFKLPKGIYGLNRPADDYETIATKAMLIVRKDMDDNDVYKITKALFEKESEITNEYPFFQLEKIVNPEESYIPIHEGALKYYKKNEPSFVDRNSNVIAIILSVLGLILSAIPLFLELKKRDSEKSDVLLFPASSTESVLRTQKVSRPIPKAKTKKKANNIE